MEKRASTSSDDEDANKEASGDQRERRPEVESFPKAPEVGVEAQSRPEAPRTAPVKILLFGGIVAAQDFEKEDLFVHYFFHLSEGWTSSCPLFGVTHCSRTRGTERAEVAHFSHPFQMDLTWTGPNREDGDLDSVAQLYLEVISQDFWSRFHVEGYAYCDVPNNPGRTSMSLKTWRPVSTRLGSRMRRFFTGGDPQLRDLSNTAVPADAAPGKRLSKYGIVTETSGTVSVVLNVVRQTTSKSQENETIRRFLGTIGKRATQSSITAVLASFHRARSRMLAARAGHQV